MTNDCLPEAALLRYLRGEAATEESGALEKHVEQCEACERQLRQLAAGEGSSVASEIASAASVSSEDVPPEIAGYQILDRLGRGGMGVVWDAFDAKLRRRVAIKTIQRRFSGSAELRRRFLAEAEVTARLQHPGIVPIYDRGDLADGRPYLAMKLVGNTTLASVLARRQGIGQTLTEFLEVFEQVCRAVAYAHQQGVIHRDLKPANVMIGDFGETQVMDWGLAKIVDPGGVRPDDVFEIIEESISADRAPSAKSESAPDVMEEAGATDRPAGTAGVVGTLAYMPPEQAQGNMEDLGPASDVFALGAILCEVLTGQPPYTGTLSELHQRAAGCQLASALQRLDESGAEPELVTLAKVCLRPDPAHRPASASVVAERIRQYRAGVQERLRSAENERLKTEVRLAEERRRRKVVWTFAASVMLFVVAACGAGAWYAQERAEYARKDAERLQRELAEGHVEQARDQLSVGEWESALKSIERAEEQAYPDPTGAGILRLEAYYGLNRMDDARRLIAALRQGPVSDRYAGRLLLWDHETGEAPPEERRRLLEEARAQGDLDQADELYARALGVSSTTEAFPLLLEAVSQNPRHLRAQQFVIWTDFFSGRFADAHVRCEALRVMFPRDATAYVVELLSAAATGDVEKTQLGLVAVERQFGESATVQLRGMVELLAKLTRLFNREELINDGDFLELFADWPAVAALGGAADNVQLRMPPQLSAAATELVAAFSAALFQDQKSAQEHFGKAAEAHPDGFIYYCMAWQELARQDYALAAEKLRLAIDRPSFLPIRRHAIYYLLRSDTTRLGVPEGGKRNREHLIDFSRDPIPSPDTIAACALIAWQTGELEAMRRFACKWQEIAPEAGGAEEILAIADFEENKLKGGDDGPLVLSAIAHALKALARPRDPSLMKQGMGHNDARSMLKLLGDQARAATESLGK